MAQGEVGVDVGSIREWSVAIRDWAGRFFRVSSPGRAADPARPALVRVLGVWLPVKGLVIAALVGLGVAFAGPYYTGAYGFPARLVYWEGTILASFFVWAMTFQVLERWSRSRQWLGAVRVLITNTVMAALGSLLAVVLGMVLRFDAPGSWPGQWMAIFLPFWGTAMVIVTPIILLVSGMPRMKPAATPGGTGAGSLDLLNARLPEAARGRLLYAKAEDHYLKIHTDRGHALVLMRLRDLPALVGAERGMQVHRSYWVARDAVTELEPSGRDLTVRVANGDRVPVSRRHRQAVMAWVDGPSAERR